MNKQVSSLLNEARALASTPFKESDLKNELIVARDDKHAGVSKYINKGVVKEDATGLSIDFYSEATNQLNVSENAFMVGNNSKAINYAEQAHENIANLIKELRGLNK